MLKLSKKADYAMVALSHLQQTNEPASAKEIAEIYDLSPPMLANVLKALSGAGYLQSKRGASGGYFLNQAPREISLGSVIATIDGQQSFSDCSNLLKYCQSEPNCPARMPMQMIHRKIKSFVDSISLADLAKPEDLKGITLNSNRSK